MTIFNSEDCNAGTDLDEFIPSSGNNDWVGGVRAETDARNPLSVALVDDSELAITESIPQFDAAIPRSGDDLAVVGGERDGEDIVGVSNEAAGGLTSRELPKAEGLVPGSGQSVGTVRGDDLQYISR